MSKTFDRLHGLVWTYHGPESMILIISPAVRDGMTNAERMYLRRVAEERNIDIRVDCAMQKDTAILMNRNDYKPFTMEDE